MNTSIKKLKNYKVFCRNDSEPCGTVRDICFYDGSAMADALLIDTLSLIPIIKAVSLNEIDFINEKSIFLKADCLPKSKANLKNLCKTPLIETEKIQNVSLGGRLYGLRDMEFDFETGIITDIVVSRNKITKKTKIPINKITVKDNTIYVE